MSHHFKIPEIRVSYDLPKVLVDKVEPRLIENKNKMAVKLNDIIAFL